MVKYWRGICFLFFLAGLNAFAQSYPEIKFQTFFGSPLHKERPYRIVKVSDKDFYILGSRQDSKGNEDGIIFHVSDKGEMLGKQIFEGNGNDIIRDGVYVPTTSELYFVGTTGSSLKHNESSHQLFASDYWVGKIANNGKVIWNKTFGGSENDLGNGIALTPEGGAFVCGNCWSSDLNVNCKFPLNNNWMIKLSPYGSLIKQTCWGGKKNDWGITACATADKGFLVAGITTSEELDNSKSRAMGDVFIQKLDSNLKTIWFRIFKEPYEDHVFRIIEGTGGMIFLVGGSYTTDKDKQFWFVKLNSSGETITNKKWGGTGVEELTSVYECMDGELILCGYSYYTQLNNSNIKGGKDIWVFKTDNIGNLIWQKTYGGPRDEFPADIIEGEPDTYFLVASKINNFTEKDGTSDDIWFLKIKEQGCKTIKPFFITDIHGEKTEIDVPIKFINQSENCERFLWDFGDGTTSTEKMPVKIYKKNGMFLPRLTAYTNEKCIEVYVSPKPIVIE